MSDAADRHREFAGTFTSTVLGVTDWDSPSPVQGWRARDVVGHLTGWLPEFLASSSEVRLAPGPSVDVDPVAAWTSHCAAVQMLLDDDVAASRRITNPHLGDMDVGHAVNQIYTTDVFLHTWDLTRATGQDDRLDPAVCEALLAGMEPMADMLLASGQYGPRVPVPADADAQSRLLGLIGRDPTWAPSRPVTT